MSDLTLNTMSSFLICLVLIETLVIVVVWWSRSAWYHYSAGRAIMALLMAQSGIIALAVISRIFGYEFPGRDYVYCAVYLLLAIVMGWVGVTIVLAQNEDRKTKKLADAVTKEE